jgi:hypothetical protein
MPDTLQQLVDRIPVAERGAPITVDLHNTLRQVLILLATQGVGTPTTGAKTLTLAPAFLLFGGGPNWVNLNGFASPPGLVAEGWLPVHLPESARIDSMVVKGRRAGNVGTFQVRLRYNPLDPDEIARMLVTVNLATASDPFEVTGQVSIPGLSGSALLDARTVKNDGRIYFVTASVDDVGDGENDLVEIHSIQINYTMGAS